MRMCRFVTAVVTAVTLASWPASAQPNASLIVDVDWLSQHLKDPDVVVLHVGTREEYAAAHIAGSRLITEDDVSRPHNHSDLKDMMLELPDASTLRTKVAQFGISDTSRVIVVFSAPEARPVGDADRLHARLSRTRCADVAAERRPGGLEACRQTRHHGCSTDGARHIDRAPRRDTSSSMRHSHRRCHRAPDSSWWTRGRPFSTRASSRR